MKYFLVLLITFGVYFSVSGQERKSLADEISELEQERLECLRKRYVSIKLLIEEGISDHVSLIQPKIDLLNCQIEYAPSPDRKVELYRELMGEYDKLIRDAELSLEAPPRAGRQLSMIEPQILFLKSEKLRIEILLAKVETNKD